jgi:hypothetical protein
VEEWTRIEKRGAAVGAILGWLIWGLIVGALGWAAWLWIPGALVGAYVGYRWAVGQEIRRSYVDLRPSPSERVAAPSGMEPMQPGKARQAARTERAHCVDCGGILPKGRENPRCVTCAEAAEG